MARSAKTPKFKEFNSSKNAFGPRAQNPNQWSDYLDDSKPLNLELGCGKAEVTLALATNNPDQNYIGIDLKADRLWRASKNALERKINNVAFIQANILDIGEIFDNDTVNSIWITFPDPFPKKRQIKHRMMNPVFLDIYRNILLPHGVVRLKTDNQQFFEWAEELIVAEDDILVLERSEDLHNSELNEEYKIPTTFEKRFINEGKSIKYLSFSFDSA